MAGLFDIRKVVVGPEKLTATIAVSADAPLMTYENLESTSLVYYLAPGIVDQKCLGDAGETFKDCMGATELPHLLEHLTIEIMNESGLAGRIVSGRTRCVNEDERLFEVELSCPDDVLTVGALSSAVFMMEWAYLRRDQPAPDFKGTVAALAHLVESLGGATASDDDADQQAVPSDPGVTGQL